MREALLLSVLLAPALGYSTPPGIYRTANYRDAAALSERIAQLARPGGSSATVAVIGGGLRSLLRIFIGALLFIQWLLLG